MSDTAHAASGDDVQDVQRLAGGGERSGEAHVGSPRGKAVHNAQDKLARYAARVVGDDPSEDDNKHDEFITTQPSAKLFQRFVLKPDRVGNAHASNGAPASGVRGRLAKAMQAGTNKTASAERAAKRASGRGEGSSEDEAALAQRRERPARKMVKRSNATPDVRRSRRERTNVDYRDQLPEGAAVLQSDSDEASAVDDSDDAGSASASHSSGAASGEDVDDDEVTFAAAAGPSTVAPAERRQGSGAVLDSDSDAADDAAADVANDSDVECLGAPPPMHYTVDDVHRILADKTENGKRSYLVKFKGVSYRHLKWWPHGALMAARRTLVHAYQRKLDQGAAPVHVNGTPDGVAPDWRVAERVIARRMRSGRRQYLVKWGVLGYAESTWEDAAALTSDEDKAVVARFERHSRPPPAQRKAAAEDLIRLMQRGDGVPAFRNGRTLRDYQVTSFEWMVQNNLKGQSCILGDEMGLGKTAQSISVMEFRRAKARVRGPFLVVAPLTTLGHWRREIETWTDMNVVCFSGGKDDRAIIEAHELYFPGAGRGAGGPMFDVLLTNPEMLRDCASVFGRFRWDMTIVDEAHKLKGLTSEIRRSVEALRTAWLLLLTGTPIQNNMQELFSIMNLVAPARVHDLAAFLAAYGDPPRTPSSPAQLQALQEELRPLLLRRMKEDVETLPDKEEIIIWVELTTYQREYYKALFEQNIASLLSTTNKNLPNLRNLAMELRKLCCHPFLCNGLEDDLRMRLTTLAGAAPGDGELLEAASGKLALLGKLLPKLRREGRKVLIFSQFKIMLNVVSDYLDLLALPYERIDGDTAGPQRQAAMDRFQGGGDGTFAFLLSTKAGGQGITLTAANTIILYDSDWNPQNDVQAMARAHRIGQTSEVTIYRLITHGTYEETLINTANQKSGLNEAILDSSACVDPEANAARIQRLLREGANSIANDADAEAQAAQFAGQDIDDILRSRTSRRNIGNKGGSSFSVATFRAEGGGDRGDESGGAQGAAFWQDLLPEAVKAHKKAEAERNLVHGPRARRRINYREPQPHGDADYNAAVDAAGSDDGADEDYGAERAREERAERNEVIAAAMDTAAAVAVAVDAGGERAAGSAPPDGKRAAQKALLKAIGDVDAMLLRWGPLQVEEAIQAMANADLSRDVVEQMPSRLWRVASAAQDVATSLEMPVRNVAPLIAEWRAVLQARAPGFPTKRPSGNRAIARAGQEAKERLLAGGLTDAEAAAAHAAEHAAADETRRVNAKFAQAIDTAVTDVLSKHACHYVQSLWPGPADIEVLQQHVYYRALRGAFARLTQHASRDALYAAATHSHTDAAELLVHTLAQGWPLPQPEEGSALHFLSLHGLWKAGATVDGRVITCGLVNGIDASSTAVSRSDSAPFPLDVLSAIVREPFASATLEHAPAGAVARSRAKEAWAVYKSADKGKLHMSTALHTAVAFELARRFVDLARYIVAHAKLSKRPSEQQAPAPAGAAAPAAAGPSAPAPAGPAARPLGSEAAAGNGPMIGGGAGPARVGAIGKSSKPTKHPLPLKSLTNKSKSSGGVDLQAWLSSGKLKGGASGGKAVRSASAASKENSRPHGGAAPAPVSMRAPLAENGPVIDLCAAEGSLGPVAREPCEASSADGAEDNTMSTSDEEGCSLADVTSEHDAGRLTDSGMDVDVAESDALLQM